MKAETKAPHVDHLCLAWSGGSALWFGPSNPLLPPRPGRHPQASAAASAKATRWIGAAPLGQGREFSNQGMGRPPADTATWVSWAVRDGAECS